MTTTTTTASESPRIRRAERHEQQAFLATGFVHLDDLWSADFAAGLREDARAGWAHAVAPPTGPRTPLTDVGKAPRRQTRVAGGPVLAALHAALVPVVRALTGRLLVPTYATYGYYELDDHCLLHVDNPDCELTVLANPLGSVGALHIHPELLGRSMEELGALECDADWDRNGGVSVGPYPELGVSVMRGHQLPHHRPGQPVPELSAVAALFYRSLF